MQTFTRAAALAALLGAAPLAAGAATVLDQQDAVIDGSIGLGITTTHLGQSFTVGVSGIFAGFEARVDLLSETPADLTVTLRTTSGGLPTNTVLATAILTAADAASATVDYVDFSTAGVAVTAGDMLAVLFETTIGDEYSLDGDYSGSYAGGTRVGSGDGGATFTSLSRFDVTFATYVTTPDADVPLPAAAPLMAAGLAGLVAASRRRRG